VRNSTSYEAGMPRPRWPIFLITRNERPYKGWWGSRTSTTSGNDSSDSLLGTFLNPLAGGDRLEKSATKLEAAERGLGFKKFWGAEKSRRKSLIL
jgi:hypothetical protein